MNAFRWHSINIVPNVASIAVHADDPPWDHIGTYMEVCAFGFIVHASVPFKLPTFDTALWGPVYSRRAKTWRYIPYRDRI